MDWLIALKGLGGIDALMNTVIILSGLFWT